MKILLLITFLTFTDSIFAKDSTVVRSAIWGMTPAEILAGENAQLIDSGDIDGELYQTYFGEMAGFEIYAVYYFHLDTNGVQRLNTVKLTFERQLIVGAALENDFRTIEKSLVLRYGAPQVNDEEWSSDKHRETFNGKPGEAIAMGVLSYYQEWSTSTRIILHTLLTDSDNETWHVVQYSDPMYIQPVGDDGL